MKTPPNPAPRVYRQGGLLKGSFEMVGNGSVVPHRLLDLLGLLRHFDAPRWRLWSKKLHFTLFRSGWRATDRDEGMPPTSTAKFCTEPVYRPLSPGSTCWLREADRTKLLGCLEPASAPEACRPASSPFHSVSDHEDAVRNRMPLADVDQ